MIQKAVIAATIVAFAGLLPARTLAQDASARIQGTIVSATATSVTVTTPSGNRTARFDPHVRIFVRSKASIDQVTDNSFIGTTVIPQPDGSYTSTEVHVFAPALRGTGEGFTKMNAGGTRMMANATVHVPVNMMANSTVHAVSTDAGGKTISMTFPSGQKTIHIPANVPVTYLAPGSKEVLTKGTSVLLIGTGTPASLTARFVVISKR